MIKPACRDPDNRNIPLVSEKKHSPREDSGSVMDPVGSGFRNAYPCYVVRIDRHAAGRDDQIRPFADKPAYLK
ncbi:MAG: hypothetical protein A2V65_04910 [Deltaproteobacteria bacterium RBG_13_49_15]|nr:MAG: hypothetical protein A2V65_04910 [Deltaproteobacteria bacterium RBG_13_49_15]